MVEMSKECEREIHKLNTAKDILRAYTREELVEIIGEISEGDYPKVVAYHNYLVKIRRGGWDELSEYIRIMIKKLKMRII
jgi:hypothetical protein